MWKTAIFIHELKVRHIIHVLLTVHVNRGDVKVMFFIMDVSFRKVVFLNVFDIRQFFKVLNIPNKDVLVKLVLKKLKNSYLINIFIFF